MEKIELDKIEKAARVGGEVLRKYFGESLEQKVKSTLADIKTRADEESEEAIFNSLSVDFPMAGFFLEERGAIEVEREMKFVVDPLDGTNNFVLGLPNFAVSIALYKKEKLIAGVVYNPILDRMYSAVLGEGATVNGKKIVINEINNLAQCTVSCMFGYINSDDYRNGLFRKLDELEVKRTLTNWSVAIDLCLLAEGKIEAAINNNTDIYDFSAGKLIAKEAGAKITNFEGELETDDKNPIFLISNGTKIHQEIMDILKK